MRINRSKFGAALLIGGLALGGAACGSDENGNGATTDEEVNQVDEGVEKGANRAKNEVKQGVDAVDDGK